MDGELQNWGEASKMVLQCSAETGIPVMGPCWQYLHVSVFVRDTWMQTGNRHRVVDDGWRFYCCYTVDSWAAVRPTFLRFFHQHALYHRAAFFVEGWLWTPGEGWETHPHF